PASARCRWTYTTRTGTTGTSCRAPCRWRAWRGWSTVRRRWPDDRHGSARHRRRPAAGRAPATGRLPRRAARRQPAGGGAVAPARHEADLERRRAARDQPARFGTRAVAGYLGTAGDAGVLLHRRVPAPAIVPAGVPALPVGGAGRHRGTAA